MGWVFKKVRGSCEGVDDVLDLLVVASGTSPPFFGASFRCLAGGDRVEVFFGGDLKRNGVRFGLSVKLKDV